MAPYDTAKEILARVFPSQIFRQQASSDWQGEFPLPHPVAEYYAELGPSDARIQAYGNPYFLPILELSAGYRYHPRGIAFDLSREGLQSSK
jgi:hypothetical protein